jgi:hypothetical protein
MKYLCLIYHDEQAWAKLPKPELEAVMSEYFAFTEDIKRSSHWQGGEALHPTSTATTVRVRNCGATTTDGPFAEAREQLGGFYMIDAKDLNEAIRVAGRIPAARWGAVEVRPVVDFSQETHAR